MPLLSSQRLQNAHGLPINCVIAPGYGGATRAHQIVYLLSATATSR